MLDDQIRLLLAHDTPLFRDGLATVFARCPDVRVVGLASSGREAIDQARRTRPSVVLMDTRLPVMDGITAMREILADLPDTRIALLTETHDGAGLLEAVRAGARGYITKDITIYGLIDAVRRLDRGEAVITPHLAARLLDEFAALARNGDGAWPPVEAEHAKVTERERDVLELLVEGATNRDISRELMITENTVKVHLRNILDKLHLRNRQQAAAFAISSGLVRLCREDGRVRQHA